MMIRVYKIIRKRCNCSAGIRRIVVQPVVFACFVILSFLPESYAQNPYARIDNHALKAPRSVTNSIDSLAEYLVRPARNETEKARSIFRWITYNISYDVDAFLNQTAVMMSADEVLKSRNSVCQGFSLLFERLAKSAGLEVITIRGFAKGYSYSPSEDFSESNHAWNAVKIDGVWRLIDATWGAGHIDISGKFIHKLEEHFFLIKPQELIFTHFPEMSKMQFMKNPISKKKFLSLPYLKPAFFKNNLKLKSHLGCEISAKGELILELITPKDTHLIASLLKDNKHLDKALTFSQKKSGVYNINVAFPKSGKYKLRIFAAKGRQETYDWVMDYVIDAKNSSYDPTCYPTALGDFRFRNAYLHSPMQGILKSGRNYHFKIDVPNAEEVILFDGPDYHYLKKESPNGHTFSGDITVNNNDIRIGAKFDKQGSYSILLEYK